MAQKSGEYVIESLMKKFIRISHHKIEEFANSNEVSIRKGIRQVDDVEFQNLLQALNACAENSLPSLLKVLLDWHDRTYITSLSSKPTTKSDKSKLPDVCATSEHIIEHNNPNLINDSLTGIGSENEIVDSRKIDRKNHAIDFIFCHSIISVLKQLHLHPGHDEYINVIISMAFKHFKFLDEVVTGPYNNLINEIADLYAEVVGVLTQSRFHLIRMKFNNKLKLLRTTDGGIANNSNIIVSLLMGMKFFRVKMYPIEDFMDCFNFLTELAHFFLEVDDKKIKHALAGLLVEVLLPVGAVVKHEVNIPILKSFVELLYNPCMDMCGKRKHFFALSPLGTCLLSVSQKPFFLNNWPSLMMMCLGQLKNRDTKISRVALESLFRLLWVYIVRIKGEKHADTQSKLYSIVNSLFPKGSKTVVPRDASTNIFVKIIHFIAQEKLDFAMEVIFDLIGANRSSKVLLLPERMNIGLCAFLLIALSLQLREGEPPMPQKPNSSDCSTSVTNTPTNNTSSNGTTGAAGSSSASSKLTVTNSPVSNNKVVVNANNVPGGNNQNIGGPDISGQSNKAAPPRPLFPPQLNKNQASNQLSPIQNASQTGVSSQFNDNYIHFSHNSRLARLKQQQQPVSTNPNAPAPPQSTNSISLTLTGHPPTTNQNQGTVNSTATVSTTKRRLSYAFMTLNDSNSASIGIRNYISPVRKAFDTMLKMLDQQVIRTMMLTKQENINKESEEVITAERKPKIDLLKTCVGAIPRLLPSDMCKSDLVELLSRLSIHVDEELRMLAQQALINIIQEFPNWRYKTLQTFLNFVQKEIQDNSPAQLESSLKIIYHLINAWKTAFYASTPSTQQHHFLTMLSSNPNDKAFSNINSSKALDKTLLDDIEGFCLVMLCQYRSSIRRLSVYILREVKCLMGLIHMDLQQQQDEQNPPNTINQQRFCIDTLDHAGSEILRKVLSALPANEKAVLLNAYSHHTLDFMSFAERTNPVWGVIVSNTNTNNNNSTIIGNNKQTRAGSSEYQSNNSRSNASSTNNTSGTSGSNNNVLSNSGIGNSGSHGSSTAGATNLNSNNTNSSNQNQSHPSHSDKHQQNLINRNLWMDAIAVMYSRHNLMATSQLSLQKAWYFLMDRINYLLPIIDPNAQMAENRASIILKSSSSNKKPLTPTEREHTMLLWKNYIMMACSIAKPTYSVNIQTGNLAGYGGLSASGGLVGNAYMYASGGSSGTKMQKTGVEQQIAENSVLKSSYSSSSATHNKSTSKDLLKHLIPLIKCEVVELRECVIKALGHFNHYALLDLMDEMNVLIREGIDKKQENLRRRRRKDQLRLYILQIYEILTGNGMFKNSEDGTQQLDRIIEWLETLRPLLIGSPNSDPNTASNNNSGSNTTNISLSSNPLPNSSSTTLNSGITTPINASSIMSVGSVMANVLPTSTSITNTAHMLLPGSSGPSTSSAGPTQHHMSSMIEGDKTATRIHFCRLIENIILQNEPRERRKSPLIETFKHEVFWMLASWIGDFNKPFQHIRIYSNSGLNSRNRKNNRMESIDELCYASIRTMCAILCCGPIFDQQQSIAEDGYIIPWITNIIDSGIEKLQHLCEETLSYLLIYNNETHTLLDELIDCCYTSSFAVSKIVFLAIMRAFTFSTGSSNPTNTHNATAPISSTNTPGHHSHQSNTSNASYQQQNSDSTSILEYPCDHISMITLTLTYISNLDTQIRECALQLLLLLYHRFLADSCDGVIVKNGINNQSPGAKASWSDLPSPFKSDQLLHWNQMEISNYLAEMFPELTLSIFSEITQRLETATNHMQIELCHCLRPWLFNIELVDYLPHESGVTRPSNIPNAPNNVAGGGSGNNSAGNTRVFARNSHHYRHTRSSSPTSLSGESSRVYQGLPGVGWGSRQSTDLVLNNLFYLTIVHGQELNGELDQLWLNLIRYKLENISVIIHYLVLITTLAPTNILPFAKQVIVFLGKEKPKNLIENLFYSLQTIDGVNCIVERQVNIPFFRIITPVNQPTTSTSNKPGNTVFDDADDTFAYEVEFTDEERLNYKSSCSTLLRNSKSATTKHQQQARNVNILSRSLDYSQICSLANNKTAGVNSNNNNCDNGVTTTNNNHVNTRSLMMSNSPQLPTARSATATMETNSVSMVSKAATAINISSTKKRRTFSGSKQNSLTSKEDFKDSSTVDDYKDYGPNSLQSNLNNWTEDDKYATLRPKDVRKHAGSSKTMHVGTVIERSKSKHSPSVSHQPQPQYKLEYSQPRPLPLPAYGGHYASLDSTSYLGHNSVFTSPSSWEGWSEQYNYTGLMCDWSGNNNCSSGNTNGSNVSWTQNYKTVLVLMLFVDLVPIKATRQYWERDIELLLHCIVLGLDHREYLVHEQCKLLLVKLLQIICSDKEEWRLLVLLMTGTNALSSKNITTSYQSNSNCLQITNLNEIQANDWWTSFQLLWNNRVTFTNEKREVNLTTNQNKSVPQTTEKQQQPKQTSMPPQISSNISKESSLQRTVSSYSVASTDTLIHNAKLTNSATNSKSSPMATSPPRDTNLQEKNDNGSGQTKEMSDTKFQRHTQISECDENNIAPSDTIALDEPDELIKLFCFSRGKPMWHYEDVSTSRYLLEASVPSNHNFDSSSSEQSLLRLLSSSDQLTYLVQKLCNLIDGDGTVLIRWAQLALNTGVNCTHRHYASRSLQIFRALCQTYDASKMSALFSRLLDTIGDQNEDVQCYVVELLMTIEAAIVNIIPPAPIPRVKKTRLSNSGAPNHFRRSYHYPMKYNQDRNEKRVDSHNNDDYDEELDSSDVEDLKLINASVMEQNFEVNGDKEDPKNKPQHLKTSFSSPKLSSVNKNDQGKDIHQSLGIKRNTIEELDPKKKENIKSPIMGKVNSSKKTLEEISPPKQSIPLSTTNCNGISGEERQDLLCELFWLANVLLESELEHEYCAGLRYLERLLPVFFSRINNTYNELISVAESSSNIGLLFQEDVTATAATNKRSTWCVDVNTNNQATSPRNPQPHQGNQRNPWQYYNRHNHHHYTRNNYMGSASSNKSDDLVQKLEKLIPRLSWGNDEFPGTIHLVIKGCLNKTLWPIASSILSDLILYTSPCSNGSNYPSNCSCDMCSASNIIDPCCSNHSNSNNLRLGFPYGVVTLLMTLFNLSTNENGGNSANFIPANRRAAYNIARVIQYDTPNYSGNNMGQQPSEGSSNSSSSAGTNKLGNLLAVMKLYAAGSFTKDRAQWTKCVIKYLHDGCEEWSGFGSVGSGCGAVELLAFIGRLLEESPAFMHSSLLQSLGHLIQCIPVSSSNTHIYNQLTLLTDHLTTSPFLNNTSNVWRESSHVLRLIVARASSLVVAPHTASTSVPSFSTSAARNIPINQQTSSSTSSLMMPIVPVPEAETPRIELPGRVLDCDLDISSYSTSSVTSLPVGSVTLNQNPDVSMNNHSNSNTTKKGGLVSTSSFNSQAPVYVNCKTKELLYQLINAFGTYGYRIGFPKSPSVIFSQSTETLEHQISLHSSSETASTNDVSLAGDLRLDETSSIEQAQVIRDLDEYLDSQLKINFLDLPDDNWEDEKKPSWGVRSASITNQYLNTLTGSTHGPLQVATPPDGLLSHNSSSLLNSSLECGGTTHDSSFPSPNITKPTTSANIATASTSASSGSVVKRPHSLEIKKQTNPIVIVKLTEEREEDYTSITKSDIDGSSPIPIGNPDKKSLTGANTMDQSSQQLPQPSSSTSPILSSELTRNIAFLKDNHKEMSPEKKRFSLITTTTEEDDDDDDNDDSDDEQSIDCDEDYDKEIRKINRRQMKMSQEEKQRKQFGNDTDEDIKRKKMFSSSLDRSSSNNYEKEVEFVWCDSLSKVLDSPSINLDDSSPSDWMMTTSGSSTIEELDQSQTNKSFITNENPSLLDIQIANKKYVCNLWTKFPLLFEDCCSKCKTCINEGNYYVAVVPQLKNVGSKFVEIIKRISNYLKTPLFYIGENNLSSFPSILEQHKLTLMQLQETYDKFCNHVDYSFEILDLLKRSKRITITNEHCVKPDEKRLSLCRQLHKMLTQLLLLYQTQCRFITDLYTSLIDKSTNNSDSTSKSEDFSTQLSQLSYQLNQQHNKLLSSQSTTNTNKTSFNKTMLLSMDSSTMVASSNKNLEHCGKALQISDVKNIENDLYSCMVEKKYTQAIQIWNNNRVSLVMLNKSLIDCDNPVYYLLQVFCRFYTKLHPNTVAYTPLTTTSTIDLLPQSSSSSIDSALSLNTDIDANQLAIELLTISTSLTQLERHQQSSKKYVTTSATTSVNTATSTICRRYDSSDEDDEDEDDDTSIMRNQLKQIEPQIPGGVPNIKNNLGNNTGTSDSSVV